MVEQRRPITVSYNVCAAVHAAVGASVNALARFSFVAPPTVVPIVFAVGQIGPAGNNPSS